MVLSRELSLRAPAESNHREFRETSQRGGGLEEVLHSQAVELEASVQETPGGFVRFISRKQQRARAEVR